MEVITRAQAKAADQKHYFTGKPCKNGHIDRRRTACCNCVACGREKSKRYELKHLDRRSARNARYYAEQAAINAADPAAKEEYLVRKRKASRKHARLHPNRRNARTAKRRAYKKQATPPWYEGDKLMGCLYSLGKLMSKVIHNNCDMEVDHRIGLTPEIDGIGGVSGLHCYDNLLPIPLLENRKKLNKFNLDTHTHMLGCLYMHPVIN